MICSKSSVPIGQNVALWSITWYLDVTWISYSDILVPGFSQPIFVQTLSGFIRVATKFEGLTFQLGFSLWIPFKCFYWYLFLLRLQIQFLEKWNQSINSLFRLKQLFCLLIQNLCLPWTRSYLISEYEYLDKSSHEGACTNCSSWWIFDLNETNGVPVPSS